MEGIHCLRKKLQQVVRPWAIFPVQIEKTAVTEFIAPYAIKTYQKETDNK